MRRGAGLTCAFSPPGRAPTSRRSGWPAARATRSCSTAGVRIYEWQPSVLHSKTFVVDGLWRTIGSMNFDNRSLALNDEATLMILDERLGQQMVAIFLDDLRHSEEIVMQQFGRRWYFERVAEDTANALERLL